jgi:hypothetical protein
MDMRSLAPITRDWEAAVIAAAPVVVSKSLRVMNGSLEHQLEPELHLAGRKSLSDSAKGTGGYAGGGRLKIGFV